MQYLTAADSSNVIEGEFSYDLLKLTENKLSDVFTDLAQTVNKPALYK